jgi:DNA repair photolyase
MSRGRSRAVDPLEVFADEFAQDAPADEFGCLDDDGPTRFTEPPSDTIAPVARKGRGAVSNRVGRFEPYARERVDDGWTNTDPYQPVEREMKITRGILEVLAEHDHPVTIVTKSDLIVRDLDILGPMAAKGLAKVGVSVTTLDRELARKLEPRASRPDKRLAAIRACAAAGVPTAVMVAPVIPAVNDHEIEPILEAAVAAGADSAAWILLRLPLEIADLIEEFLRSHFPDRAERVLSLVRQTRDGRLYRAEWGKRMRGDGPYAQMIAQRFRAACGRLGLTGRTGGLDTTRFRAPTPPRAQLSLFGD